MNRKIISIRADDDFTMESEQESCFPSTYEGYVIEVETGEKLCLGVTNEQNCCEQTGYASSEDDFSHFIGAELLGYAIVDPEQFVKANKLLGKDVFFTGEGDLAEGDMMFLNVETSVGMLQFTVYNSHNGYYGHYACVSFGKDVIEETTL